MEQVVQGHVQKQHDEVLGLPVDPGHQALRQKEYHDVVRDVCFAHSGLLPGEQDQGDATDCQDYVRPRCNL